MWDSWWDSCCNIDTRILIFLGAAGRAPHSETLRHCPAASAARRPYARERARRRTAKRGVRRCVGGRDGGIGTDNGQESSDSRRFLAMYGGWRIRRTHAIPASATPANGRLHASRGLHARKSALTIAEFRHFSRGSCARGADQATCAACPPAPPNRRNPSLGQPPAMYGGSSGHMMPRHGPSATR